VQVTFHNVRLKSELSERLSSQLMLKSSELDALLNDADFCRSLGFTPEDIHAMFIPNTYNVYWNISAASFMQRMKREYNAFWSEARREKASEIGISLVEVSTLASIVEEESSELSEYPTIAGVYINRLHRNIPLQADPTIKYALGNFSLTRILNSHLTIESPYNTYLHLGLPPGPIRIPSIYAIDAVLNYQPHNYLFMCARDDFSGYHSFAATASEHNRNASRYHAALNRHRVR
jgi:UPF0755 protein